MSGKLLSKSLVLLLLELSLLKNVSVDNTLLVDLVEFCHTLQTGLGAQ